MSPAMLPPFIIDQIRRREEEERRRREEREQPRVEIPADTYHPAPGVPEHHDDADRGVVILDLGWSAGAEDT
ncbi:hypothetical protein ACFL5O_05410 [Myxococcota bacterium]